MPKFKEIVVLSVLPVNGKDYHKGDVVRTVEITEQEAKYNNAHPNLNGCKYVPVKTEAQVKAEEAATAKKELRAGLFKKAEELKLDIAKNTPTKLLIAKIVEAEKLQADIAEKEADEETEEKTNKK